MIRTSNHDRKFLINAKNGAYLNWATEAAAQRNADKIGKKYGCVVTVVEHRSMLGVGYYLIASKYIA